MCEDKPGLKISAASNPINEAEMELRFGCLTDENLQLSKVAN